MKKRILSALLCALMLLPLCLTGCGDGSASSYVTTTPMTVTIYTITNEETTEEGIAAAEEAINAITEYEFGTHVVLKALSAEEYSDIVYQKMQNMKAQYVEPEEVETTAAAVGDESAESVDPMEETKVYKKKEDVVYPTPTEDQVDILLITSIDEFNTYCKDAQLAPLSDYLIGKSAIINKFVNPTLMNAGKWAVDGIQYAIPNNRIVGEYEYLMLARTLVDSYYYDSEDIHTILQLEQYVNDVTTLNPEYTPILDTYGVSTLTLSLCGEDSFFGSYVGYNAQANTNAMPKVLFSVSKYQKEMSYLRTLRANGYMVEGEPGSLNAAAMFVKGNITAKDAYADDYYASVYKYPTATNENVYDSMYAVSAYTHSVSRCMEILTYLQTNEEFRNVFQYGKEGENYSVDKDGMVTILNNEYSMDPSYTGNQFLLRQNTSMDESELAISANGWELGKEQNKQMASSSYLGFSPYTTEVYYEDEDSMGDAPFTVEQMMSEISRISDYYEEQVNAYTGPGGDDYIAFLDALGEEMSDNEYVKCALRKNFKTAPFAMYVAWYKLLYKSDEKAGA